MTFDQNRDFEGVARALGAFIDASPSPYHVCATVRARLSSQGFVAVREADAWDAVPPRGFVERGGSIFAWVLPDACAATRGFRIVGAHTDSPNLRVKPRPDSGRAGFRQLGVEVYGGVLLNSWLDRDLGLSGRVFLSSDGGAVEQRTFRIDRPILRVPQLAIHLDRDVSTSGLVLDRQQHMAPVLGVGPPVEGTFQRLLSEVLQVEADRIKSWEAMVHDLTPSTVLGWQNDMLAAPRLDNLCSAFCGLEAVLAAAERGATRPIAVTLFDHEEVGSASRGGADGPLLSDVVERLVLSRGGGRSDYLRCLQDSFCLSADMAHAVHPNYADRHEPDHHVFLNAGPVIKINSNQRYATEAETEARFQLACERAAVPYQKWVMRTNLACGSTIGPITASRHGIRTVDIGCAQLSMHSARELCGVKDPAYMVAALTEALLESE